MKKIFSVIGIVAGALALTAQMLDNPYGVCAHVSRMPERKSAAREFKAMNDGGITWVRTDFDWKFIQKKPGEWDYSHLDELLETAGEYRMNILPILGYDVEWVVPVYKNLDQWREYVRRTVSRYAKRLRYWEVWNEANIMNGPKYTRLNAEQYTEILKAAYEEIKKIDPNLQVVYTGTAGVPVEFIEKSLKAGAARYFDVMNIHPYASSTYPENTRELVDPLLKLFARYHIEKPIWVTEFSWPTHKARTVVPPLAAALKSLAIDPRTITVAVIRNKDFDDQGKEFAGEDFTLKLFPRRKEIGYADLKNLDVTEYPVLVPSLSEAFPRRYFPDVLDYVRRGGILILNVNGFPFYYDALQDASGKWTRKQTASADLMKALHVKWLAAWQDKVPASGTIKAAEGSGLSSVQYSGGERYLSPANLKEGDNMIPILIQEKDRFAAPVLAVYRLNSDLKGAVIMNVMRIGSGVSQNVQGKFLPRAYLYFLATGVERAFWYKFLAEEYDKYCIGHHFGIVHRDLSPRDAFVAHRFLVNMCPSGSTRPIMTHDGQLYRASWKRPDGAKVYAYWTVKDPVEFKLPFAVREAYDYLGRKMVVADTITACDSLVYLITR